MHYLCRAINQDFPTFKFYMLMNVLPSSVNDYYILPGAFTIVLNAMGDKDSLSAGVFANAQITVFRKGVIDYNAVGNYRQWTLVAFNTHFDDPEARYCHVALAREGDVATLVWPPTRLDINGVAIDDAGTEAIAGEGDDAGQASGSHWYVYLGKISASIDGPRTWAERLRYGELDTDRYRNEDMAGAWSKMFSLNELNNTITQHLPFGALRLGVADEPIVDVWTRADAERVPSVDDVPQPDATIPSIGFTREYLREHYLSKTSADTARGRITFTGGIVAAEAKVEERIDFGQALQGSTGAGIWRDENGWHIQTDYLEVFNMARFAELEIRKVSHVGGSLLLTAADCSASRVEQSGEDFVVYFAASNSEGVEIVNGWEVDDIAYCQTFNLMRQADGSMANRFYKYVVKEKGTTAQGEHFIVLDAERKALGSVAPVAGDSIVQLGNTSNLDRQSAIMIDGSSNPPSIREFAHIDGFVLPEPQIQLEPGNNIFTGLVKMSSDSMVGNQSIASLLEDYATKSELAAYQYLVRNLARANTTEIDGGLVLSSTMLLKDADNATVMAGINGITRADEPGRGLAAWYGGEMIDKATASGAEAHMVARSAFRFDGSGYLANNKIRWDGEGNGSILDYISWNTDSVGNDVFMIGGTEGFVIEGGVMKLGSGITIQGDSVENILRNILNRIEEFHGMFELVSSEGRKYIKAKHDGLYSEGFISAFGVNASAGGGGGYSIQIVGSGNNVSDVAYADGVLKFTKSNISVADMATMTWVRSQGYLTSHQDISGKQDVITDLSTIRGNAAKGATAYSWGNHALAGYALASAVSNVDNTADADKSVKYAMSAGNAANAAKLGNVSLENILTASTELSNNTTQDQISFNLENSGVTTVAWGGFIANRPEDWVAGSNHFGSLATFGAKGGNRFQLLSDTSTLSLYYRSTHGTSFNAWYKILDAHNSAVSKSGETLSVKINGTTHSITNTWRGVVNNLTSGGTALSLSAEQGKILKGYIDTINGYFTNGVANKANADAEGNVISTTYLTKNAFGELFEKVNIGSSSNPKWVIKAKLSLYSEGAISAFGHNDSGSGGGGYNIVINGNGNNVSNVAYADGTLTFTKSNISVADMATMTWVRSQGYALTSAIPTALKSPFALTFGSKTYDGSSALTISASDLGALTTNLKGTANGLAELDGSGKVPSSQLPSYVDDVLEFATKSSFPSQGESGKIYIDKATNLTYRWSGTAYVEISPSLALGETSSTAYRGDRGKIAYDHAAAKGSAFASGLYKITTNSQGHVTAASAVVKADITALGIPAQDTNTWRPVVDSLTSSATAESLSANQGRLLANGSARDNTKVAKSGDTMTGNLTVPSISANSITFDRPTEAGQKRSIMFNGVTDNAQIYYYEPNLQDDGRLVLHMADNDSDPIIFRWDLYRSSESGGALRNQDVHRFDASGYTLKPVADSSSISIITAADLQGYLGSSTKRFKAVYAETHYGTLSGNASTATTLQTSRTLWGQTFNGSGNISGAISNTGNVTPSTSKGSDIGSNTLSYRYGYFVWLGSMANTSFDIAANNQNSHIHIAIDGKIGIGTVTPSQKLDINGILKLSGTAKKIMFGDTYYIELDSSGNIHTNANLYSDKSISAFGSNAASGGAGGYNVVINGSGNNVSNVAYADGTLTFTKSNISVADMATMTWVRSQGYALTSGTYGGLNVGYATSAGSASGANVLNINNTAGLSNCMQYIQTSTQTTGNDLPSSNNWWHVIKLNHGNGDTYYSRNLAFDFFSNTIKTRCRKGGTASEWETIAFVSDIPSKLPANGGNADTLDNEHASAFVHLANNETITGVKTFSSAPIIATSSFGALTLKRNDETNGASIKFQGSSSVYGYIGFNASAKDAGLLRWNSAATAAYTIIDTGNFTVHLNSTYVNVSGDKMTGVLTLSSGTNAAYDKTALSFVKTNTTTEHARIGTDLNGGLGLYSIGNIYLRPAVALGSASTNGLIIGADSLTFKGNNVYHAGNKPSKADVGLGNVTNLAASGYFTAMSHQANTNNISITIGGTTKTLALGSNAWNSTAYLPLAGGTMTGALTLKNGTWNPVGDDAAIGDVNIAGALGIKALNTANPSLQFYNNGGTNVGSITINGTTLQYGSNKIWHAGNDGAGSGLNADQLDGFHADDLVRYATAYWKSGWYKVAENTTGGNAESFITFHVVNSQQNRQALLHIRLRGNGTVNFHCLYNQGFDLTTFRLYSNDSQRKLYVKVTGDWQGVVFRVLNEGREGTGEKNWTLFKYSLSEAPDNDIDSVSGYLYPTLSGSVNYASSAGNASNADMIDNYHASSLWRSDGAIWNPGANVSLKATANNQEWSFDINRNGMTGCYWHVWDYTHGTLLKVTADDGKIHAPKGGFVGSLSGNASTATKLATARTLWGKSFDGSANVSGEISSTGTVTPSSTKASDIGSNALSFRYGYFTWLGSASDTGLDIAASNQNSHIHISTSGNVGINTATPNYKLHVNGSTYLGGMTTFLSETNTAGLKASGSNATINALTNQFLVLGDAIRFGAYGTWDWDAWAGLKYDHGKKTIYLGTATGSPFNYRSGAQTGGFVRLSGCSLVAEGEVSAYSSASDMRLKDVTCRDYDALSILQGLSTFKYRWNGVARSIAPIYRDTEEHFGLSAQEIKSLANYLVSENIIEGKYMSMRKEELVPVLVQAIKQLLHRVERLEARNTEKY